MAYRKRCQIDSENQSDNSANQGYQFTEDINKSPCIPQSVSWQLIIDSHLAAQKVFTSLTRLFTDQSTKSSHTSVLHTSYLHTYLPWTYLNTILIAIRHHKSILLLKFPIRCWKHFGFPIHTCFSTPTVNLPAVPLLFLNSPGIPLSAKISCNVEVYGLVFQAVP